LKLPLAFVYKRSVSLHKYKSIYFTQRLTHFKKTNNIFLLAILRYYIIKERYSLGLNREIIISINVTIVSINSVILIIKKLKVMILLLLRKTTFNLINLI